MWVRPKTRTIRPPWIRPAKRWSAGPYLFHVRRSKQGAVRVSGCDPMTLSPTSLAAVADECPLLGEVFPRGSVKLISYEAYHRPPSKKAKSAGAGSSAVAMIVVNRQRDQ
jgi:hypothetical protein